MNNAALVITQDLDLNMMRILDEFLDVNTGIAKRLFRLVTRGIIAFDQGNIIVGNAHSASTATGHGLDHHRITDFFGDNLRILLILHNAFGTGRRLHAGLFGQGTAYRLVLQCIHRMWTGADEFDVAAFADLGEMGVF